MYDEALTRYHYRHNRRGATAANTIESLGKCLVV